MPDSSPLDNAGVAARLSEVADLLAAQAAPPGRVQAWRRAAALVRGHTEPLREQLAARGLPGLLLLPGLGVSLAQAIEQLAGCGRLPLLEHLRGRPAGAEAFATVVGIGPELARRIHDNLGIDSLYELELAAHDGRLAGVRGMGRSRLSAVQQALAGRFRRAADLPEALRRRRDAEQPAIADLLAIDRDYRDSAAAEQLPCIALDRPGAPPRRLLPVLHCEQHGRQFTAMFAPTARGREPGGARQAVRIQRDDAEGDGCWTIVTADLGSARGCRIVRGRESECRTFYRDGQTAGAR